ncbi:MAG: sugar ABC transporter permease [Clostridia bacterium]|nr:sugar ABC transporter permease [Clostridia bacterium]
MGYVEDSVFTFLQISSIIILLGIISVCVSAALSFGNEKARQIGLFFLPSGGCATGAGLLGVYLLYKRIENPQNTSVSLEFLHKQVPPNFPWQFWLYLGFAISAVILFISISAANKFSLRKGKFEITEKYRLFLYAFPIILLTFIFSYLTLKGFSMAFYETSNTGINTFVGFKWFAYLFTDGAVFERFIRVIRNTLVMSGLGLITSWLPVAFAVFFSEIKNNAVRKVVQTLTTLPNFISWILVYAVALSLFSTSGLLNHVIEAFTGTSPEKSWLEINNTVWLQMLIWGIWKGTGWSAIIYIAAISGIDQGMYEAAEIDGAKRFGKMWYITVPMLIPTYSVMLLLAFANVLSNGLDQYLVFSNPKNIENIEVLDLYVYNLGFNAQGNSDATKPLATVISMSKTVISLALLFIANWTSKSIRGESII